jgi:hypothetical protein
MKQWMAFTTPLCPTYHARLQIVPTNGRDGKHCLDSSGFVELKVCFDRVACLQRVLQISQN